MKQKIHHHIHSARTNPDYGKILLLRTFGNFLVLASLFMIAKTFYLPVKEEIAYFINKNIDKQYVVAQTVDEEASLNSQLEQTNQPKGLLANVLQIKPVEVLAPQDPNYSIIIPKIGANSRITTTGVSEEKDYLDVLKTGVAHAQGTSFPGESGHIFLFAHSTDYFWNVGAYNAIFYLLYKLEPQDEVDLFYQGQRYVYRVTGKEIIDPSQVEYLTKKTDREFLTLQTCWPPGTTLKRMLVFAERVVE